MRINIYHTNDIHSNYEFLKKVHKYLRDNKKENDIYIDSGDFLDLCSILVEAEGGKFAMPLIMDAGLDSMTIGNGEMDLGKDRLISLLEENDYPIISSNVFDISHGEIPGLKKSIIIERLGVRFLVLGVTPYYGREFTFSSYNKFFNLGQLETVDPIDTLIKEIKDNEGQYDFVIFASHSGHVADPHILSHVNGIDLTLAAHTHKIMTSLDYTMSGRGECLGKVTLEIEGKDVKVIDSVQIYLDEEVDNPRFDKLIEDQYKKARLSLSQEILLKEELAFDPLKENMLINFLCDALYKFYDVDLALMNNGIAEKGLGKVTSKLEVIETFPSKLNPTIFNLQGWQIKEALEDSQKEGFASQSGHGPGFRGHILGVLSFSHNVEIKDDMINIDGKEIEDHKTYRVASTDYLQRGTGYRCLVSEEISFDKYMIKEFMLLKLNDDEIYETAKIKRLK